MPALTHPDFGQLRAVFDAPPGPATDQLDGFTCYRLRDARIQDVLLDREGRVISCGAPTGLDAENLILADQLIERGESQGTLFRSPGRIAPATPFDFIRFLQQAYPDMLERFREQAEDPFLRQHTLVFALAYNTYDEEAPVAALHYVAAIDHDVPFVVRDDDFTRYRLTRRLNLPR